MSSEPLLPDAQSKGAAWERVARTVALAVMSLQDHLLHVVPASDPTEAPQDSGRQTSSEMPPGPVSRLIRAAGQDISLLRPESWRMPMLRANQDRIRPPQHVTLWHVDCLALEIETLWAHEKLLSRCLQGLH